LAQAGTSWAVSAVFTFHPNGYVRERALDYLAASAQPIALSFALLRINDWVPIIRDKARALVHERLRTVSASQVFDNVPLINRMRQWRRTDHTPLLAEIERKLADPASAEAREAALRHHNGIVRRTALVVALRAEPERAAELVTYAVSSHDRTLRRKAVAFLRHLPVEEMLPLAHLFLLDTDGAIRNWAQRVVHQHEPGFELDRFYRERLGEDAEPRGALYGLGEMGAATDAEAALPYVSHRLTRVRRAALYALANLDIDRFVEQFTASIADPSLRVARDAVAWLVRYPHVVAVHRETIRIRGASYGPTAKRRVDAVLRAGEAYRRRWMQA